MDEIHVFLITAQVDDLRESWQAAILPPRRDRDIITGPRAVRVGLSLERGLEIHFCVPGLNQNAAMLWARKEAQCYGFGVKELHLSHPIKELTP